MKLTRTVAASPAIRRMGEVGGLVLTIAGTWIVVIGAAMPWLTTGSVQRSAFAVARSARNLGLADAPVRRIALILLFATPMLAGMALLALSTGRRVLALALSGLIGALGVIGSLVGAQLPGNHEVGASLSGFGGIMSILGIVTSAVAVTRKVQEHGRHEFARGWQRFG